MAPLPQNLTSRLFVDYVTGFHDGAQEHTLAWRCQNLLEDHAIPQSHVYGFLVARSQMNFRVGWRVVRTRFQVAGADFSVPVPTIEALAEFVGSYGGAYSGVIEATEDTYVGRSLTTGRRARLSLFRAATAPNDNFRELAVGSNTAANSIAYLNARSAATELVAIDNSSPVWYGYINLNVNSHWERVQRF